MVDITSVSPLDKELLAEDAGRCRIIATVEDNVLAGGVGEAIGNFLAERKSGGQGALHMGFGWPDVFVEHGKAEELYARYGLDGRSIAERIAERIEG